MTYIARKVHSFNRQYLYPEKSFVFGGSTVRVVRFASLETFDKNLKAMMDIEVDGFRICFGRIVQQPKTQAYFQMPQQRLKDGSWRPVVSIRDEVLKKKISDFALAVWRDFSEKGGAHGTER